MCRAHKNAAAIQRWAVHTLRPASSLSRGGFTLIELLLAMLIMAMVVGALAALTKGVQLANEYGEGYGTATQHARITAERINRAVAGAYAKSLYPGVWVTQDTVGQWAYPDTLVVWSPSGAPANPSGPPLVQELLIFCPDPAVAGSFVQLNVPGDTRTVPTTTPATVNTFIDSLKTSSTANKVQLTNLLRMAVPSGTTSSPARGAVRFVVNYTPSVSAWNSYLAGTLPWSSLNWSQGMHSQITGTRQVWVRYELQLNPGATWVAGNSAGAITIPFLGSASLYYGMP